MKIGGRRVLVCDCAGSMAVDGEAIARACEADAAPRLHYALCRADFAAFEEAVGRGEPLLVACTQEAPLFSEVAEDADIAFLNIRERAGWAREGDSAGAKVAALLAEAAVPQPLTPAVTFESAGEVVVIGRDEQVLAAAERLSGRLSVRLLLAPGVDVMPPLLARFRIHSGQAISASGHLGAFSLVANGYADADPSSRSWLAFGPPRDGATLDADLILDLSGGTPLFPAHATRDGYMRPDPGDPLAVERALFDLADMVGKFDKPRYVAFDGTLCAHSRSRKTGCTRCLDVCPTGAIVPAGDSIAVDAAVCAGCGGCESVCPTGAIAYALPSGETLTDRLRALLTTYRRAGGEAPVLLLHDLAEGEALIAAIARFGDGLPANVLPVALDRTTALAPDVLLAAAAFGAGRVLILVGGRQDEARTGLMQAVSLCEFILQGFGYGAGCIRVMDERSPDGLAVALWEDAETLAYTDFAPLGSKRERIGLALAHLHSHAPRPVDDLALPAGAPFGAVRVDAERCTLCQSCVGACPTGALSDNPDRPQLGFTEALCVQCGLCRTTCPEDVVSLTPRLLFTAAARERVILYEEEPFACTRCGRPFGVVSVVERVLTQLARNPLFAGDEAALNRVRMCEDCRVAVQFEAEAPMAGPNRPLPRTSDD